MPVVGRSEETEGEPPDTTTLPPNAAGNDHHHPTDGDEAGDGVLAAEREHLRRSRECLALMRENVLSLRALAGDRVSQEYLKADLYHRAQALADLPDTPLFFGRIDYTPTGRGDAPEPDDTAGRPDTTDPRGETFHIGRRHVHDPGGRPMVIDWRAPLSRPFYRASRADPMGLVLRRRFGFSGGTLTAYEDEPLAATVTTADSADQTATTHSGPEASAPPAAVSRLVIEEIERPRSGPMRDIVATIQPEQDDIVRADAGQTVCVQGAPGTGKTAVGLHRVAYLLYAHPHRVTRRGVLVIGPNRAFLSYIRDVLPALGEADVRQVTVADLVASVPVRGQDPPAVAAVKGDARMAEVLRRAVWSQISTEGMPAIVLPRGSRRWRIAAYELDELVGELRGRGVRYGAARELLGHRIAHVILTRMESAGEACDDRTHDAVRRSRQVRAAVDAVWPKVDPVRLVWRLLGDPAALAAAAGGLLSDTEQAAICWAKPPRGPGSARWSAADAVLIDEARDLVERTPSLSHVVVDEAQDLSPMQCRAIGRRCATGSATVLGDLAQATTPWAATSWAELLGHLGKPDATLRVLGTGYRVPRQILDYASRLLGHIAPDLAPPVSLRADPGALEVVAADRAGFGRRLAGVCERACGLPGSVAVIAADRQVGELSRLLARFGVGHHVLGGQPAGSAGRAVPDEFPADGSGGGEFPDTAAAGPADAAPRRVTLVPVTLAKGLEFDHVIVVEPARIADAEARGPHRLYVALTRAVSRLTVLHTAPLPTPLRAAV